MSTIRKTIDVKATTDQVWSKISDVGNIGNLIGFLQDSQIEGDDRICTTSDGGIIKEKIISVDENLKRVVYSITESPLNMEFHVAIMELEEIEGGVRLNWTVDVIPAEATEHMEPMIEAAISDMEISLAA